MRAGPAATPGIPQDGIFGAVWGTVATAAFLIAAELLYWHLDRSILPEASGLRALRLGHVALAVAVAAVVLGRRCRPPWLPWVGFVALVVPVFPVIWVTEREMLATGGPWAPFVGAKVVSLVIALAFPGPIRVGALLIGLLLAESLISWSVLDLGARSGVAALREPWVTVLVCLGALGFLAFRARQVQRDRELARARARAESLEELTRLFLAIRDRTNTPLQTLEISTALLRRKLPEATILADRMEAALVRLREFSGLLSDYEDSLRLRSGAERTEVEALLAQLEREVTCLRRQAPT